MRKAAGTRAEDSAVTLITQSTPDTWRDLEVECAKILRECGFDVEQPRVIETVRETVEVDIYAEEEVEGRRYALVCECKHWKSRVPQEVTHAFRTVMADIGANAGYVISTAGFQEGAFAAVRNTNVKLVTWPEFQAAFVESWYRTYFAPTLEHRLGSLMTYAEPIPPSWLGHLTEEELEEFVELRRTHMHFGFLLLSFVYGQWRRPKDSPLPELPLEGHVTDIEKLGPIPESVSKASGFRDFLEAATEYGVGVLEEFRTYQDRALVRQQELDAQE